MSKRLLKDSLFQSQLFLGLGVVPLFPEWHHPSFSPSIHVSYACAREQHSKGQGHRGENGLSFFITPLRISRQSFPAPHSMCTQSATDLHV